MIHYNLRCGEDHEFEAWFQSSAAFDAQVKRRQVECPNCGDTNVTKAPMAPTVRATKPNLQGPAKIRQELRRLREHVEKNCDYVGERFAEEARKIHHGEVEERSIYGESTDAEAVALADEGVKFARIPWIRREDG